MQTPLEIGTVIDGKYRVERAIGAGGMGMLFLARHLQLGERVAIKVLKPERSGRPGVVERLLREARAAASIRNRHVVRVLDVGTLPDGQPFIVMEYLEGEDLAALLARGGSLPIADAIDHLLQACEALAEAHALGIVHRDLKPANLFLERRASGAVSVKVVDFGVARFLAGHINAAQADSGLTHSHAIVGSPAYVSPEQLTTPDEVDTRADIWALGVILYEMLSGRQPFTAPTLALTCTRILQEPPPALERTDVTPELMRVLERALEKAPKRRFASVLELGVALAPYGSSQARESLTEIEAVARRAPGSPELAAPTEPSAPTETGFPTLTGSVLKVRHPAPPLRPRPAFVLLAAVAAVAGVAGLRQAAPRRALPGSNESGPYATSVPPPTRATITPDVASPLPPPAPAPAASRQAPGAAEPPLPPASASVKRSLPVKPAASPAPGPRPSAAAVVASAPSPASSEHPPTDESERLYEFRK